MKTNSWVKLALIVLLGWNVALSYFYYKQSKSLKIAERTLYDKYDPIYYGDEKPDWKEKRDAMINHFNK